MKITLSKQAEKYLNRCDAKTYALLEMAIDNLIAGKGNVAKIQGKPNTYRLKRPPYRIIFRRVGENELYVEGIYPRGDAYKKG